MKHIVLAISLFIGQYTFATAPLKLEKKVRPATQKKYQEYTQSEQVFPGMEARRPLLAPLVLTQPQQIQRLFTLTTETDPTDLRNFVESPIPSRVATSPNNTGLYDHLLDQCSDIPEEELPLEASPLFLTPGGCDDYQRSSVAGLCLCNHERMLRERTNLGTNFETDPEVQKLQKKYHDMLQSQRVKKFLDVEASLIKQAAATGPERAVLQQPQPTNFEQCLPTYETDLTNAVLAAKSCGEEKDIVRAQLNDYAKSQGKRPASEQDVAYELINRKLREIYGSKENWNKMFGHIPNSQALRAAFNNPEFNAMAKLREARALSFDAISGDKKLDTLFQVKDENGVVKFYEPCLSMDQFYRMRAAYKFEKYASVLNNPQYLKTMETVYRVMQQLSSRPKATANDVINEILSKFDATSYLPGNDRIMAEVGDSIEGFVDSLREIKGILGTSKNLHILLHDRKAFQDFFASQQSKETTAGPRRAPASNSSNPLSTLLNRHLEQYAQDFHTPKMVAAQDRYLQTSCNPQIMSALICPPKQETGDLNFYNEYLVDKDQRGSVIDAPYTDMFCKGVICKNSRNRTNPRHAQYCKGYSESGSKEEAQAISDLDSLYANGNDIVSFNTQNEKESEYQYFNRLICPKLHNYKEDPIMDKFVIDRSNARNPLDLARELETSCKDASLYPALGAPTDPAKQEKALRCRILGLAQFACVGVPALNDPNFGSDRCRANRLRPLAQQQGENGEIIRLTVNPNNELYNSLGQLVGRFDPDTKKFYDLNGREIDSYGRPMAFVSAKDVFTRNPYQIASNSNNSGGNFWERLRNLGNSSNQAVQRLRRDHPEIAAKLEAGQALDPKEQFIATRAGLFRPITESLESAAQREAQEKAQRRPASLGRNNPNVNQVSPNIDANISTANAQKETLANTTVATAAIQDRLAGTSAQLADLSAEQAAQIPSTNRKIAEQSQIIDQSSRNIEEYEKKISDIEDRQMANKLGKADVLDSALNRKPPEVTADDQKKIMDMEKKLQQLAKDKKDQEELLANEKMKKEQAQIQLAELKKKKEQQQKAAEEAEELKAKAEVAKNATFTTREKAKKLFKENPAIRPPVPSRSLASIATINRGVPRGPQRERAETRALTPTTSTGKISYDQVSQSQDDLGLKNYVLVSDGSFQEIPLPKLREALGTAMDKIGAGEAEFGSFEFVMIANTRYMLTQTEQGMELIPVDLAYIPEFGDIPLVDNSKVRINVEEATSAEDVLAYIQGAISTEYEKIKSSSSDVAAADYAMRAKLYRQANEIAVTVSGFDEELSKLSFEVEYEYSEL